MGIRRVVITLVLLAFSSLGAFAADTAPAEKAPDTMQARVMGCAACHGAQGEGTSNDYYPRLSGKPAGYLYNQLLAFRDGRRQVPANELFISVSPRSVSAGKLPNTLPANVLHSRTCRRSTADAATLALGKSLVNNGAAARKIPACAACHGAALTGMEPAIPGLLGLHSDYISAQLGAWRYGTRKTLAPDCMHDIATKLADRDITAIAAYLASLPAPADPVPVAAGSLKMPLACGTVPNQ